MRVLTGILTVRGKERRGTLAASHHEERERESHMIRLRRLIASDCDQILICSSLLHHCVP